MRYRTCIQYYNVCVFFECFPVCVVCRVFVCVCVRVCLGIHLNSYAANIYRFFSGAFVHTFIHLAVLACSIPLATISGTFGKSKDSEFFLQVVRSQKKKSSKNPKL